MNTVNFRGFPAAQRANDKRRRVTRFHRHLANPLVRLMARCLPGVALPETTGRRSGRARRTPVVGRVENGWFWMVSDHGLASQYVRNIAVDPQMRIQVGGW